MVYCSFQMFLVIFAHSYSNLLMQEKEKPYNGFWKQLGCILSVIAIFGIIALFVVGFYLFIKGF